MSSDSIRRNLTIILRTFLQAFVAALLASPVLHIDMPTLRAAAIAGIAAAASAVHNLILDPSPVPSLEVNR